MARESLGAGVRVLFVVSGLGFVGLAVLLALQSANDMTSVAALLVGVLLLIVAGVGRLPEEIGLQRITFGQPAAAAREYRKALYDAVNTALPDLAPPTRGHDWLPERPTYWVDELRLRIIVTWAPDNSYRIDVSRIEPGTPADPNIGVMLVTNVDEIDDLRSALQSQHGQRSAVVRWRSPADNEALRQTAHELQAHDGS